ncbi:MAG: hypothetical protein ACRC9L_06230 [Brevinema sp.]
MKKLVIFSLVVLLGARGYGQETSANSVKAPASSAAPNRWGPVFSFFNIYFEYGTGELSAPIGQRGMSALDSKMTYSQNFSSARWLTMGFVAQALWLPTAQRLLTPGLTKLSSPFSMDLSGTIGVFNILTFSVSSQGTMGPFIWWNYRLPNSGRMYSHTFIFMLDARFYILGTQTSASTITQSAFDSLEIRVAYQMRFVKWFALRPEFQFVINGTIMARTTALDAFRLRFNPRLQFFWEEASFFIEPRFFWFGNGQVAINRFADGKNFQWEIKFGFDITKFVIR